MKRKWIIVSGVIIFLIIIRLSLPYYLKNKANKKLSEIKGHYGVVHDIDLSLITGTYILDSVDIFKLGNSIPTPLIALKKAIISLDPEAIKQGKFLVKVDIRDAIVNLIKAPYTLTEGVDSGKSVVVKQFGGGVKWMKEFKRLSPFNFNELIVQNSTIRYQDQTTSPNIDLAAKSIEIRVENLGNLRNKKNDSLPSPIIISASTSGGGHFQLDGKLNFQKKEPDVDLKIQLKNVELVILNDLIGKDTQISIEGGKMDVRSELKIKNKRLDGFIKPEISHLKILSEEEKSKPFDDIFEKVTGFFSSLLKNNDEKIISTIPLKGDIKNPDIGYVHAVFSIFKNAFLEGYDAELTKSTEEKEK